MYALCSLYKYAIVICNKLLYIYLFTYLLTTFFLCLEAQLGAMYMNNVKVYQMTQKIIPQCFWPISQKRLRILIYFFTNLFTVSIYDPRPNKI